MWNLWHGGCCLICSGRCCVNAVNVRVTSTDCCVCGLPMRRTRLNPDICSDLLMSDARVIFRIVLLAVAVTLVAVVASGQRQSSRRGKLKPSVAVQVSGSQCPPFDTVAVAEGMVSFAGYEKNVACHQGDGVSKQPFPKGGCTGGFPRYIL